MPPMNDFPEFIVTRLGANLLVNAGLTMGEKVVAAVNWHDNIYVFTNYGDILKLQFPLPY